MATATAVVERSRLVRYLAWLVVAASVLTIWPPLHIHRLMTSTTGQTDSGATEQARRIADSFWNGTLAAGAVNALDIRYVGRATTDAAGRGAALRPYR